MVRRKTESRNEQLMRILQLIRTLDRSGGVDLYELADDAGCGVRTIRRDLAAIEAAGLPLERERDGRRQRWRIDYASRLRRVTELIDVSHFLALQLALGGGGLSRHPSQLDALEDLAAKLERALGKKEMHHLRDVIGCFRFLPRQPYVEQKPDRVWPFVSAILERRVCRVLYRSGGADRSRWLRVLPLRLFVHDDATYLLAWGSKHRAAITLNLHRVEQIHVTKTVAAIPRGFDLQAWGRSTFVLAGGGRPVRHVLRFSAEVAPLIRERSWHPTQLLRALRGGGVELAFDCAPSYEVTAWVASWRSEVTVIEPVALREELGAVGQWMARTYAEE